MQDAYELEASLTENEEKTPEERQWWILKPSMSDRGQGIRLFSTMEELKEVFENFEEEEEEGGDEDEGPVGEKKAEGNETIPTSSNHNTSVITNQMRHFICQKYIHPPLLISSRKFHIRTYVLAVGFLSVYVYKPMLALFAGPPYIPPWEISNTDLSAALTNTCLQTGEREGNVRLFWDLKPVLPGGENMLSDIFTRICAIIAEIFDAAAKEQRVHFQTLPNAFEIFGVDFLIHADMKTVSLLEVNSYPDFRQTGKELGGLIERLLEEVIKVAIEPFVGVDSERNGEGGGETELVKVLEVDLGRF